MKNFYSLTKTLLVAVCLLVGGSAWATDYYSTSTSAGVTTTEMHFNQYIYDAVARTGTQAFVLNGNSVTTVDSKTVYVVNDITGSRNLRMFNYIAMEDAYSMRHGSSKAIGAYDTGGDGIYTTNNPDQYISIINLHQGDKVTIWHNGAVMFRSTNVTETVSVGDTPTSGTEYTIASGTQLDLRHCKKNSNNYIGVIKIVSNYDAVSNPSIAITAQTGTSTTATITAGISTSGSAVTTYYTTDGRTPTPADNDGSFTTATGDVVFNSSNTLKVISVTSGTFGGTSYVVSEDIEVVELVSAPTIGDPVYEGADRTVTITSGESSESNAVTTYYTIDGSTPSASHNDGSFTTTTTDVTISSNCTVKAISISSTDVESTVSSRAITAGKLKLNAPTLTKTSYSAGKYTVKITSDQSSLEFVPESPVIKYSIDGGEEETYSAPFEVVAGKNVVAHVEKADYTNSDNKELGTLARTGWKQDWTQDYTQVSKAAGTGHKQINLSGTVAFTNVKRNFYNIASYTDGDPVVVSVTTNVGLDTNNSFYFRCNGANSGILKNGGSTGYLGIQNLSEGQYISISKSNVVLSVESGAVLVEEMSTTGEQVFKATSNIASFGVSKGTYNYIYSITVYSNAESFNSLKEKANALVAVPNDNSAANSTLSAAITTQTSAVASAATADDIKTAIGTLKTAMNTYVSAANPTTGNQFDLTYMLTNPDVENVVDWEAPELFGWNTDYTGDNFAVRTNLNSELNGIERWSSSAYTTADTWAIYQQVTLPKGNYSFDAKAFANQTSAIVMAAGSTEGDAITSSDFADYSVEFTQDSESEIKVGLKISSEGTNTCNWTAVTGMKLYKEPASSVSKTITSAGWATYCSPYALDFSSAIANLSAAYLVVGGADGYVTKSSPITTTIPANTGILLRGEGVVTIPVVASSSTDVSANKLIGKTAEYDLAAGAGYVLMNDATYGVGFYQNEKAFTVGANTAYLPANFDGETARSFFGLWNDGETTGIKSLDVNDNLNNKVFDLQGRRVAQPTKGLYIVNGKKVVIK